MLHVGSIQSKYSKWAYLTISVRFVFTYFDFEAATTYQQEKTTQATVISFVCFIQRLELVLRIYRHQQVKFNKDCGQNPKSGSLKSDIY